MRYRAKDLKYCRWCGKAYNASRPIGKDGFHSTACKQAHYRAYRKYVTAKLRTLTAGKTLSKRG